MRNVAEATILVTGATDGLGKRVARELAAKGAQVLLHGRSPERLEGTLEELRGQTSSQKVGSYVADLSSLTAVRDLVGPHPLGVRSPRRACQQRWHNRPRA